MQHKITFPGAVCELAKTIGDDVRTEAALLALRGFAFVSGLRQDYLATKAMNEQVVNGTAADYQDND